jgi:hypothetical protein
LTFLLKETTLTKINFQDLNKISLSCEKFEDIKEVAVNRKVKTMQNPEKRKRRKYKQSGVNSGAPEGKQFLFH